MGVVRHGSGLLKSGYAFDLPVGMGKEIIDIRIERILFKDRNGVAGVGDDPEI